MALTFGISSIRDLFAKLQREAAALKDEVTSELLFNFVVTGYSMIDWVRNDPSVPATAKVRHVVDSLYINHWLKICGELANASKHFTLKKRNPLTTSATSARGFGVGRFGKGGFGVGEECIDIELNDGTKFHCLDLVEGVLNTWEDFFSAHGM